MNSGRKSYPSRSSVRTVDCPACKARAGDPCFNTRGKMRESNHRERVDRFEQIEQAGRR